MRTVNIHEAKTNLSRLVDQAAKGESFVIAKSGKPMVKVIPLDPLEGEGRASRFGFLRGQLSIPEDFDRLGEKEIADQFSGDE